MPVSVSGSCQLPVTVAGRTSSRAASTVFLSVVFVLVARHDGTKIRSMDKALVAGALGVTGRSLVNHLVSLGSWEVIGLSRRSPEFRTDCSIYRSGDLLNRSEVQTRLSGLGDITHIFYAALQTGSQFLCRGGTKPGHAH